MGSFGAEGLELQGGRKLPDHAERATLQTLRPSEASGIAQGASVGVDVHARSVVEHARDVASGEVRKARLTPDYRSIIDWLLALVGPVEVGPTSFGLYRAIVAARMACTVAAPSKFRRPVGDRVKTEAKVATHIEKLLWMRELVAVTVPDENTEAVCDLVHFR